MDAVLAGMHLDVSRAAAERKSVAAEAHQELLEQIMTAACQAHTCHRVLAEVLVSSRVLNRVM